MSGMTELQIAKLIDHSLLHPTFTDEDIRKGCEVARQYNCAAVCVKPYSIEFAKGLLSGSDVLICSVMGFPHGNTTIPQKVRETVECIEMGATEIDMVVNCGKVLGGDWGYVKEEIGAINEACVKNGAILKVIFENDYLQDEHIIRLCQISTEVGAAFVKTSTGYGFVKQADGGYNYKGATDHHLKLMREHSGPNVQIKAAGGVRSLDDLYRVVELGATRIGVVITAQIIEDYRKRQGLESKEVEVQAGY
jgi:deoxyribose-phosphate aldolase